MENESSSTRVLRVGDCTLDLASAELERNGVRIRLAEQPFRVLELLASHPGEVISREKLIARLWPKSTFIDVHTSLNAAVRKLRAALDDDAEVPRYIETIPRRGYRCVAKVESLSAVQNPPDVSLDSAPSRPLPPVSVPPEPPEPSPTPPPTASNPPVANTGATHLLVTMSERLRRAYRRHTRWLLAAAALLGIVLFAIGIRTRAPAPSVVAVRAPLPARTVAVLPFTNLSAVASDEYLSQGLAEAVLHRLANVPGLIVISRMSSFAFQGSKQDVRVIGARLNARYLLEGGVQRDAARLRVTVHLVDASNGTEVWSLSFDRLVDDIFAVQDEIARTVAQTLRLRLGTAAHDPTTVGGTRDLDAYLAFLQGKALMRTQKVPDAERAIERLSEAVRVDPQFAGAYAALAEAHMLHLSLTEDSLSAAREQQEAERLAARALALDSRVAPAYLVRAGLKQMRNDRTGAEADFRRAIALNPNYGTGYEEFADFLFGAGDRYDEALAVIDQARLVDPLTPRNHYLKGLILLLGGGDIDEARALFLQTLELAPDFHPALLRLAQIDAWFGGQFADAIQLAEQALAIDPRAAWVRSALVEMYLNVEDLAAAKDVLERTREPSPPWLWLPIHVFTGDLPQAAAIAREQLKSHQEDATVLAIYAVRDEAISRGNYGQARELIESALTRAKPQHDPVTIDFFNRDPLLALADLRERTGDRQGATDLIRKSLDWNAREAAHHHREHELQQHRALALALLGEDGAALEALEQSFSSGYRWGWWYTLRHEPSLARLRRLPRFEELINRARAHAATQRKLLDDLRHQGLVPDRPEGPHEASISR